MASRQPPPPPPPPPPPAPSEQPQWQTIRDAKVADVASRLPQEWQIPPSQLPPATQDNVLDVPRTCGVLTEREVHITEGYDARGLVRAIRERRFTSVEVTRAYCKRATIAHQLTNCLTEPLFPLALSRAQFLDDHLAFTGSPLGPLHGLPISIKDSFWVAGYDSSIGIASLCSSPTSQNAIIVEILLSAGAVIHVKTNVPQTLMALDSVNNIFGRTLNPTNRSQWTAGGSSGGEAALVKMRGSVLGIGTDVGGSVRIPAMCQGIYGFKPSSGRIPTEGQTSAQPEAVGKLGMEAVVGVIANEMADIGLVMGAVEAAEACKIEAGLIPGKWWTGVPTKKNKKDLLIGVVSTDGIATPLPPIRRLLSTTIRLLENSGIQTIPLPTATTTPLLASCLSLSNAFFSAPSHTHTFSLLSATSEPLIPWLQGRLKKKEPATLAALLTLQARKLRLQNDFLSIWKTEDGRELDALICPVAPHPVPGIDKWNTINYTSAFVLLDLPAAVVPIRSVMQADLEEEMEGECLGGLDRVNREMWEGDRGRYLGSPLCVQVVGRRLEERRVWEVGRLLYEAVKMGRGVEPRL